MHSKSVLGRFFTQIRYKETKAKGWIKLLVITDILAILGLDGFRALKTKVALNIKKPLRHDIKEFIVVTSDFSSFIFLYFSRIFLDLYHFVSSTNTRVAALSFSPTWVLLTGVPGEVLSCVRLRAASQIHFMCCIQMKCFWSLTQKCAMQSQWKRNDDQTDKQLENLSLSSQNQSHSRCTQPWRKICTKWWLKGYYNQWIQHRKVTPIVIVIQYIYEAGRNAESAEATGSS